MFDLKEAPNSDLKLQKKTFFKVQLKDRVDTSSVSLQGHKEKGAWAPIRGVLCSPSIILGLNTLALRASVVAVSFHCCCSGTVVSRDQEVSLAQIS